MPCYVYDVFISYNPHDVAWVRDELLQRLEQGGLRVCFDLRDFRAGEPGALELQRAIISSRRVLLVVTPAYVASTWTTAEQLISEAVDLNTYPHRIMPLHCAPVALPLSISYLDGMDFSPEQDWDRLIRLLK